MNPADQRLDHGPVGLDLVQSPPETESTARYANRKDAILETAMAVLDEHGAGGFSLAAVAKRAIARKPSSLRRSRSRPHRPGCAR